MTNNSFQKEKWRKGNWCKAVFEEVSAVIYHLKLSAVWWMCPRPS